MLHSSRVKWREVAEDDRSWKGSEVVHPLLISPHKFDVCSNGLGRKGGTLVENTLVIKMSRLANENMEALSRTMIAKKAKT